jgi:phosphoglycolate phosphatase-like HAD superfamily hydrolase
MIKGVILDLDQTLVDSTPACLARKRRDWGEVYSLIPIFHIYDGVREFIDIAKRYDVKIGIVSTAPHTYVKKVLISHSINYDVIVGYHDAAPIKPHPAPMLKALHLMNLRPDEVISFGDRYVDEKSSRSACIRFVRCLWGSDEFQLNDSHDTSSLTLSKSTELVPFLVNSISSNVNEYE